MNVSCLGWQDGDALVIFNFEQPPADQIGERLMLATLQRRRV